MPDLRTLLPPPLSAQGRKHSPRSLALATRFSVAPPAPAPTPPSRSRAISCKGARFTAAMAFEPASTNLVIELGIIPIVPLGWPFAAITFSGGSLINLRRRMLNAYVH